MKTRPSNLHNDARRGFTLMELLTVMVIMALMMSIAGVSFFKARQGAEMRGAKRAVQTTISLARQQAVVKHTRVKVQFVNDIINGKENGRMILSTMRGGDTLTNTAHEAKYLPPLIKFDSAPFDLVFNPDGSAEGVGNFPITLNQLGVTPTTALTFNRLIGAMIGGE